MTIKKKLWIVITNQIDWKISKFIKYIVSNKVLELEIETKKLISRKIITKKFYIVSIRNYFYY